MNKKYDTKKYTETLQSVKLSDSSRARIEKELDSFADFHSVRVTNDSRSKNQVSQTSVWNTVILTRFKKYSMPYLAIAAVLMVSGGTSFAAEGSLPGDALYPIKVHVNENVRSAVALSAEAEAELQAELLAERVREAEELKSEGRLEGELATQVAANIQTQAEEAEEAQSDEDVDAETKAETEASIELALLRFNTVAGLDNMLAARAQSDEMTMESEATMSTSLALEPVKVTVLVKNTEERVESLRTLLEKYKAELKADVYSELNTKLDTSAKLLIKVKVQANEEQARVVAYEAADLAGEVESELTTMGTVTIDTDTGAIIDIDFSTPPPTEPDRDDNNLPIELESNVNLDINSNSEVDSNNKPSTSGSIEGSIESTTGLSL